MKLYKQFDCDRLGEINQEILSYIKFQNFEPNQFWNPTPVKDIMQAVPVLWSWLLQHNLMVKTVAITHGTHSNCCGPHTDTPPSIYKLSWPVLNTEHTWNRWFRALPGAKTQTNHLGGTSYVDFNDLIEIDRMRVDRPAIIATGIPHDVWCEDQAQFPRWGLQCQLFNEPTEL